jgi:hypothetical protein
VKKRLSALAVLPNSLTCISLIGGDSPILDFLTSSVQNTNMLMDMGLRNMATKNAVFELERLTC